MTAADSELRNRAIYELHQLGWSLEQIVAAMKSAKGMDAAEPIIRNIIASYRRRIDAQEERARIAKLPLLEKPITELDTSVRTSNVLKDLGIKTIADFMAWSSRPKDIVLKDHVGFGRKCYEEVIVRRSEILAQIAIAEEQSGAA